MSGFAEAIQEFRTQVDRAVAKDPRDARARAAAGAAVRCGGRRRAATAT